MSRGVEARGSPGTPGVPRALFFLRGARFGLRRTRRRKKTRAMNYLPPIVAAKLLKYSMIFSSSIGLLKVNRKPGAF